MLAVNLFPRAVSAAGEDESRPIPRFVADVRAVFARYQERPDVLDAGIVLPSHGFGIEVGGVVYPLRWKTVTFGFGGEFVIARGRHVPLGPPVDTHFRSLAPQISFNFGNRQGWSYISGGLGKTSYYVQSADTVLMNGPDVRLKTINYGAGARWFWNDHLAFCLDIRIYAINPHTAVGEVFGTPRMNQLVISSGLSFH